MRWVWDLSHGTVESGCKEPLIIRAIPVRGIFVAARIMAETWKGYLTESEGVELLEQAQRAGEVLPFVAYREGRPAASAVVIRMGPVARIFGGVHVLPDFRRRHIGTELLLTILRNLKERGVAQAFVTRRLGTSLSDDDLAASNLYDRVGGVRRAPRVELLYSPLCMRHMVWRAAVEEWLAGYDVELAPVDLRRDHGRAVVLLTNSGLARQTGEGLELCCNVVFRTFVDGLLVGGVPLNREELIAGVQLLGGKERDGSRPPDRVLPAAALRQDAAGPGRDGGQEVGEAGTTACTGCCWRAPAEWAVRAEEPVDDLEIVPLDEAHVESALRVCLEGHPAGGSIAPAVRERAEDAKTGWYRAAWKYGPACGVVALRGGRPVGLLEYYPRQLAREAGFVTGRWGNDADVLTITCLQVSAGQPRRAIMEALLAACLNQLVATGPWAAVEAFGVYQRPVGPVPYWLFERQGFVRREERPRGSGAVLSMSLDDWARGRRVCK